MLVYDIALWRAAFPTNQHIVTFSSLTEHFGYVTEYGRQISFTAVAIISEHGKDKRLIITSVESH
jgi:hypothetical protein